MAGLSSPIVATSAGGRTLAFNPLRHPTPAINCFRRPPPGTSSARIAAGAFVQSTRIPSRRKPIVSMFESFSEKAITTIMLAQEESRRLGHNFVGTEQILLGLLGEGTGIPSKVFKSMGIDLGKARVEVEKIIGRGSGFLCQEIPLTPRAKRVVHNLAMKEAQKLGHNYIGPEHLLLGLLKEGEGVAIRVLESLGANPSIIQIKVIDKIIVKEMESDRVDSGSSPKIDGLKGYGPILALLKKEVIRLAEETKSVGDGSGSSTKTPTLEEYGTNLTKLAKEGGLYPIIGRQEVIKQVAQILGRLTKNNPCLVGESGVGKTTIVQGLAQWIANGDAPETMKGKKVIALDMDLLMANTKSRHESEERLKKLIDEVKQSDDVILFIDKIHTLIEQGSIDHPTNILKQALARGELKCIGATTFDDYNNHIEKDSTLSKRFQQVEVYEPSIDETIEILRAVRGRYEAHHKLKYTDEALVAAANLSHYHISDRFLPDKAIDLIDEAGSHIRIHHSKLAKDSKEFVDGLFVTKAHIHQIISSWALKNSATMEADEATIRTRAIIAGWMARAHARISDPDEFFDTYFGDRYMPDKAIELNDEAESRVSHSRKLDDGGDPIVTKDDTMKNDSSRTTHVPIEKVSTNESERLLGREDMIKKISLLLDAIGKSHPHVIDAMLRIVEDGRMMESK